MEPVQSHSAPRLWLVGGDKGGVGKSTMAAMIAATLASSRRRPVTLIDTDSSKDASSWFATRAREWPNLPQVHGQHETEQVGERACEWRERGHDVVLDVGGRDSEQLRVAMSVAELLLMPIAPSQLDLFSCKRMAQRVSEVRRWNPKLRAVFFINKAEPNWVLRHVNEEAAELCRSFAPVVETAQTMIHRRIPFAYATRDGLGILEMKSAEQAADEFWNLMLEIDPSLKEENADAVQDRSA